VWGRDAVHPTGGLLCCRMGACRAPENTGGATRHALNNCVAHSPASDLGVIWLEVLQPGTLVARVAGMLWCHRRCCCCCGLGTPAAVRAFPGGFGLGWVGFQLLDNQVVHATWLPFVHKLPNMLLSVGVGPTHAPRAFAAPLLFCELELCIWWVGHDVDKVARQPQLLALHCVLWVLCCAGCRPALLCWCALPTLLKFSVQECTRRVGAAPAVAAAAVPEDCRGQPT
jgi:hypothetical protein